jgi:hypothetical protein
LEPTRLDGVRHGAHIVQMVVVPKNGELTDGASELSQERLNPFQTVGLIDQVAGKQDEIGLGRGGRFEGALKKKA